MPSTLNTSSFDPSEKRLSFVYNSDISGFQPLDFGKLNNVEDILISFSGDGINVHQDDLNSAVDAVTAVPEKGHTISNHTSSSANGTAVSANSFRKELFLQNLATGGLYVKYGTNASNTSFNFILAGCTYANGGDGGSISDQRYTGIVSVSGAQNLTPNYISWEMT